MSPTIRQAYCDLKGRTWRSERAPDGALFFELVFPVVRRGDVSVRVPVTRAALVAVAQGLSDLAGGMIEESLHEEPGRVSFYACRDNYAGDVGFSALEKGGGHEVIHFAEHLAPSEAAGLSGSILAALEAFKKEDNESRDVQ
jgi:hypothetical protein